MMQLKGARAEKIVTGLKVAGPFLTVGSIGLSWTSNQPQGYKITDTTTSLYGLFGGFIGAAVSLGWTFSIKPLHRAVYYPSVEENRYRHHMAVKYCNTSSCR